MNIIYSNISILFDKYNVNILLYLRFHGRKRRIAVILDIKLRFGYVELLFINGVSWELNVNFILFKLIKTSM